MPLKNAMKKFFLAGLLLCDILCFDSAAGFDLVIRHGRVVDGTGNPAFFADVGVKSGRIAAIGVITEKGRQEMDAAGLIVAPGFIDVHTHADDIFQQPLAENFLRMGVTTLVVGNCGGSKLDLDRYFSDIAAKKVSVNIATLIGHNTVREKVMGGDFDRAPTPAELAQMKSVVDRAMRDGAVGLSTGLIYLPGTFSRTEEIVELARSIKPYDGIYVSHMRHEDSDIFEALDEFTRVTREAEVRGEVSHIKLGGEPSWGQADKVLTYLEKCRAGGLDITQDLYAYTASSTTLRKLIPDEAFDGGDAKCNALLADSEQRKKLAEKIKERLQKRGRTDFSYAVIAAYKHDPTLNGLNILEAAKKLHGSDSLDAQVETIFEIQQHGSGSGVFHGMNEEDMEKFMRHPNTMIASDSGLYEFGQGVPHPRGYGNNARVLGRYVRELKVLRLEDAVRKMTSLPANTFHFKQRGELREGNWADITLFDPEKISDPAIYGKPHQYAEGIPCVLVNGVVTIQDSRHTGAKAGVGLRNGR